MKKIFTLMIISLLTLNAFPQDSGFGLGIILGEPTGISGKAWLSGKTAADAGISWALTEPSIHLHADILVHNFSWVNVSNGELGFYIGLGARLQLSDDPKIGVRIPLGIDYLFESVPLDIFLELVPVFDILPDMKPTSNAGIGIRYFF